MVEYSLLYRINWFIAHPLLWRQ